MTYDVYVFDLDGTLTDPVEGITKSYQYAAAAFGIKTELADLRHFIGPPIRECFKELGFTDDNVEQGVEKFREYLSTTGLYQNAVYPDLPATLARLKAEGKVLALATNKITPFAQRILEHFNLAQYFSTVSGDEPDGSLSKDGKAEIIRIALAGIGAKKAVMLGDRKHDISGANAVGIDSIGVLWGYGSREELTEAGATHIIECADEIFAI
ncbi:MAG: HAD-IA family hydrolase [Defluviitaleaceae bacterium]|nr:HAD-IA family hydrolase [Defluviitaleaceae bacterium]